MSKQQTSNFTELPNYYKLTGTQTDIAYKGIAVLKELGIWISFKKSIFTEARKVRKQYGLNASFGNNNQCYNWFDTTFYKFFGNKPTKAKVSLPSSNTPEHLIKAGCCNALEGTNFNPETMLFDGEKLIIQYFDFQLTLEYTVKENLHLKEIRCLGKDGISQYKPKFMSMIRAEMLKDIKN